MYDRTDSLEFPRSSIVHQTYSGPRACCFATSFCLESSVLLCYLFKLALGLLVSFHLALAFYLLYSKVSALHFPL